MRDKRVLVPLPERGFDPTQCAVAWQKLKESGYKVVFATPNGTQSEGDVRVLTGQGVPPFLRKALMAPHRIVQTYEQMAWSHEFLEPLTYARIRPEFFSGIILVGGYDPAMRDYLENDLLMGAIRYCFVHNLPVGAICHGTRLVARTVAQDEARLSVLFGKKTTGLTKKQEASTYLLTRLWLGDYYRLYDEWLQDEVELKLKSAEDFLGGPGFPFPIARDSDRNLRVGFAVRDGNYVSARWSGDVHRFMHEFLHVLGKSS